MKKTPAGTSVGVADPYEFVERCDHLTDDGRCRYAIECDQRASRRDLKQLSGAVRERSERPEVSGEERPANGRRPRDHDPKFTHERRIDEFRCPVVSEAGPNWAWKDCPHFRSRNRSRECVRCGLRERRVAHSNEHPLLEEHHLSYADESRLDEPTSHEITVSLCRWCHAKIHTSWARLDDDASPDTEALAAQETRRSRELDELGFSSAAERREEAHDE